MKKWSIEVETVITPDDTVNNACVVIQNGYIEDISAGQQNGSRISVQIDNAVLLPGLINAHDHLLGTYYPKVGEGPYENWLPWDNDLKSAKVYNEREQIQSRDLYLLGGYRNLVSGGTSVQDHIPHFVQEPFLEILPTKVICDYALAHSITSFALNWGIGIEAEYRRAEEEGIPFITHIAEGFDNETVRDLDTLIAKNGLGPHSVLIHGIAFDDHDIERIAEAGATVVWCGDSNMFMFNRTAQVKKMLDAGVNVCIGTDSPMSGGLNLLHELRFDRELFPKLFGEAISNRQLVEMVTKNPARAFFLDENGSVEKGKLADLVVFHKQSSDPYASVVDAGLKDVKLVVIEGMPVYGDAEYAGLFEALDVPVQRVVLDKTEKLVIGDLEGLLRRINRAVGFVKKLPFLPVSLN